MCLFCLYLLKAETEILKIRKGPETTNTFLFKEALFYYG